MARPFRSSLPDGYFHVFARGTGGGRSLFRDDEDCLTFRALAGTERRRHRWHCHAYCLMGTHYHLVLEARREDLSRGLQRLNGLYARYFNLRHDRLGHVFAGRFSARVIEDESYLYDACAYVVLNLSRRDCATAWGPGRGHTAPSARNAVA
jgi:putative transposase